MCHKHGHRLRNPIADGIDLSLSVFQVEVLLARQSAKGGAADSDILGMSLGAQSNIFFTQGGAAVSLQS